jgi:hypothetical protein
MFNNSDFDHRPPADSPQNTVRRPKNMPDHRFFFYSKDCRLRLTALANFSSTPDGTDPRHSGTADRQTFIIIGITILRQPDGVGNDFESSPRRRHNFIVPTA